MKTTYAEESGFKPSDSIVTHFSAYLGNATSTMTARPASAS